MRTKPELDPSPSLSLLTQTDHLVKLVTPVSQARHTNQVAVVEPPHLDKLVTPTLNRSLHGYEPLLSGFVPNSNVIIDR